MSSLGLGIWKDSRAQKKMKGTRMGRTWGVEKNVAGYEMKRMG